MRVVSAENMEMTTSPNFKPQNRPMGTSRVGGRDKHGSKSYSSSEDDFHSDDNLRPYEEVKMAHNDKNLNSLDSEEHCGKGQPLSWFQGPDQDPVYGYPKHLLLIPYSEGFEVDHPKILSFWKGLREEARMANNGLQAGTEYMSSPITPLMEKSSAHTHTHRKNNGRAPSTSSTISKGRLYSYVSGSDGDDDDNDTSSSSNRKQRRDWRKGSRSTVSSSNELENSRLRNEHVSQLSLSDSDREDVPLRYSRAGTMPLPPPSAPPPPPTPYRRHSTETTTTTATTTTLKTTTIPTTTETLTVWSTNQGKLL